MKKFITILAVLCLVAQSHANGIRVAHVRTFNAFSSFRIATPYAPVVFTSFVPYAVPVPIALAPVAVSAPCGAAVVADTYGAGLGYGLGVSSYGALGVGYGSAFSVGVHRTFLRRGFRAGVVNPLDVRAPRARARIHR